MNLEKTEKDNLLNEKTDNDFKTSYVTIADVSFDVYSVKNEIVVDKNDGKLNASDCKKDTKRQNLSDVKSDLANTNDFKLASLNVRSLFPKVDEVATFVKTFNFSVFIVNESWLDESISDNDIQIPGYDVIRRDRNRQGGGVCIYIMSNLKYSILQGYGIDIESAWICIDIYSKKIVVGTVYRPPSANKFYDDSILNELEKLTAMNENVILLGDLNVDCLKSNVSQTNFIGCLEDIFSMTQLVNEPTRETPTSVSLIDVILSTKPELHGVTDVLRVSMSDHYCVQTTFNKQVNNNVKHKSLTFRNYKKFEIFRKPFNLEALKISKSQ